MRAKYLEFPSIPPYERNLILWKKMSSGLYTVIQITEGLCRMYVSSEVMSTPLVQTDYRDLTEETYLDVVARSMADLMIKYDDWVKSLLEN